MQTSFAGYFTVSKVHDLGVEWDSCSLAYERCQCLDEGFPRISIASARIKWRARRGSLDGDVEGSVKSVLLCCPHEPDIPRHRGRTLGPVDDGDIESIRYRPISC